MKLKTTAFLLLCIFLFDSCFTRKQEISAKNFDVVETNIDAIHQAFKKRTCNCELLVSTYLQRIAAYDQSTHLNSIIVTNFDAIRLVLEN